MTVIGQEKASLEDTLQHYGVLGMKWGHRRAASTTTIKNARKRDALRRQGVRSAGYEALKAKPFSADQGKKIKTYTKKKRQRNQSLDKALAARTTDGERIVLSLLGGPGGLGHITASAVVSRGLEYRYNARAAAKKASK